MELDKFRWAAQQWSIACRDYDTVTQFPLHLLDVVSQLKTGGLQCPSWIFWKEGPPPGTRHATSGYRCSQELWAPQHAVRSLLFYQDCRVSQAGNFCVWRQILQMILCTMGMQGLDSWRVFFVIAYTSIAQRGSMFRVLPFPVPPDSNSKPIHFSCLTR